MLRDVLPFVCHLDILKASIYIEDILLNLNVNINRRLLLTKSNHTKDSPDNSKQCAKRILPVNTTNEVRKSSNHISRSFGRSPSHCLGRSSGAGMFMFDDAGGNPLLCLQHVGDVAICTWGFPT